MNLREMNWYYAIEGRSQGPVTESGLKRLAREGVVGPATLVWHPGLEEWQPMAALKPEVAGISSAREPAASAAVERPAEAPPAEPGPSEKREDKGMLKRLFGRGKK